MHLIVRVLLLPRILEAFGGRTPRPSRVTLLGMPTGLAAARLLCWFVETAARPPTPTNAVLAPGTPPPAPGSLSLAAICDLETNAGLARSTAIDGIPPRPASSKIWLRCQLPEPRWAASSADLRRRSAIAIGQQHRPPLSLAFKLCRLFPRLACGMRNGLPGCPDNGKAKSRIGDPRKRVQEFDAFP